MHFRELVGFPLGPTLFEDAGEELLTGLVAASLLARELCLGGDKASFAGRLEHRRPITLQIGPHPLERRHCRIQPRELLLDFSDDPALLFEWRQQNRKFAALLKR